MCLVPNLLIIWRFQDFVSQCRCIWMWLLGLLRQRGSHRFWEDSLGQSTVLQKMLCFRLPGQKWVGYHGIPKHPNASWQGVYSDYLLGVRVYTFSRVRGSPGSLVMTFLKTNKAPEDWPCEDVYPTEIGDFSLAVLQLTAKKSAWKSIVGRCQLPFWGPVFWQVMTG